MEGLPCALFRHTELNCRLDPPSFLYLIQEHFPVVQLILEVVLSLLSFRMNESFITYFFLSFFLSSFFLLSFYH